ncbi:MAG TPA: FliH/SctL family protein [Nitrospinota bacterium]|nr:FliH/SctL family protein [Nitrospinota bacterium]
MSNVLKKIKDKGASVKFFFLKEIIKEKINRKGRAQRELFEKTNFTNNGSKASEGFLPNPFDMEIEKMLGDAKKKAETIEKEAYLKGEKRGLEGGKKKLDITINGLEKLLDEIQSHKEKKYQEAEKELLDLVLLISKKIIQQEITLNKNIVLNIVKAAITSAAGNEEIKIRINSEDYDNVVKYKEEFIKYVDGLKNISFEADNSILQGGCLIETIYGDIDARLDKQLEAMKEKLIASVEQE